MFGALGDNCLVTQLCHPAANLVRIDKFGIPDGSGFIPDILQHLFTVHPDLEFISLPAHE